MHPQRIVELAAVESDRHFRAVQQRRVPAIIISRIGLCQPQPQIRTALLAVAAIEIKLHPVTPGVVQPGVDVALLRALDTGV